ncbi:MAG: hypothetical protein RM049_18440 [Nostoc sp. DedQUE04]|uniref:plasmid mobilization protein n=1 Tax=Nostoc sp. DedQUE04 TaxID=3075390 RepID=UPI002AD325FA|nr:hypothetical protein [Nostoc sp. DedQUE04]MDZ8137254.1 hypothetical protein [Nostoc sp. DedQUE04]
MTKPKQYSERIQVVVTPKEGERIKQLANSANLSLSGYCKQLILTAINLPEDTTLDTTYVTTQDAASEYSKLWDAVSNLTKDTLAIREDVNTLATTLNTTQLVSTILPINTIQNTTTQMQSEQDLGDVDTTLPSGAILTTEQLLERLKPAILAQSTAKTEKGRQNTVANFPLDLAKAKETKLKLMTTSKDPNGYAWLPTDATRQHWVRQAS